MTRTVPFLNRADALVVFGATGDLAFKKIFPALHAMARRGRLDVPVVLVGREERTVRARETHGVERERLWSLAARGYPGYELYAQWTPRRIPVFALEPVEA